MERMLPQPTDIVRGKLPRGTAPHFVSMIIQSNDFAFSYSAQICMAFGIYFHERLEFKVVQIPVMYKEMDTYGYLVRQVVEMYYKFKG